MPVHNCCSFLCGTEHYNSSEIGLYLLDHHPQSNGFSQIQFQSKWHLQVPPYHLSRLQRLVFLQESERGTIDIETKLCEKNHILA